MKTISEYSDGFGMADYFGLSAWCIDRGEIYVFREQNVFAPSQAVSERSTPLPL